MERIDKLSNEFLNKNEDFRESTKLVADADKRAGSSGKGVDWGSWGNVDGGEVTVSGDNGSGSGSGGTKLLGSVDSARRRAGLLEDGVNDDDDEESELAALSSSSFVDVENRVLVVVDDKKVSLLS